jgi:hypothetical protein
LHISVAVHQSTDDDVQHAITPATVIKFFSVEKWRDLCGFK